MFPLRGERAMSVADKLKRLEAIHRRRAAAGKSGAADMTDEEIEDVLSQITPEHWAELLAEHGALLSSWGYGRKSGQLESRIITGE